MLTEVREIPPSPHGVRGSYCGEDVRRFMRSGMRCAEIAYEGKSAKQVQSSASRYLRKHGLSDKAYCRVSDGRCYLARFPEAR